MKYSDSSYVFSKMQNIIPVKELNALFPNGAISFAIQLNRGNAIAIQLYRLIKNLL